MDDASFAAALDEHLALRAEDAFELEALGSFQSQRPRAVREERTFADLAVGDYITAEAENPKGRWVEVVAIGEFEPRVEGHVVVTFKTPQPIGIGLHDQFVIERDPGALVIVDASAR